MEQSQQPRPRRAFLTARLKQLQAQISDYPAAVISAPMGCGKTVAATQLARSVGWKLVRLNCNSRSAAAFWRDVCHYLAPNLPEDASLPVLADAVSASGPVVLLVDDYQIVQTDGLTRRFLALALSHPETIKVLLCSRRRLLAPDSVPVCTGQVLLIQDTDLHLTADEIVPFCRSCQVLIPSDQAKKLYRASNGWMMAVFLMLADYVKSGQLRVNAALPRMLMNQTEELPGDMQEFLLSIAPVSLSFTLKQAEFLSQRSDAGAILNELLNQGFFLSWDIQEDVYHFYPLMAAALGGRLNRHPSRKAIYKRLAVWENQQKNTVKAMAACIQAGEQESMLRMLDKLPPSDARTITLAQGREWFAGCKPELLLDHPKSLLQFRWLFSYYGQEEEAAQARTLYQRARNILVQGTAPANELDLPAVLMEGCLERRPEELLAQLQRVEPLARLTNLDPVMPPFGAGVYSSPSILALWCRDGNAEQTAAMLAKAENECPGAQMLPLTCAGETAQAEAMYYAGNLGDARIHTQRARRRADREAEYLILPVRALEVRILFANGKMERMNQVMDATRQLLTEKFGAGSSQIAGLEMVSAFIWAVSQHPGHPAQWLRSGDFDTGLLPAAVIPLAKVCHALVLCRQGRYTQIISLGPELLEEDTAPIIRIYGLLALSAACERLGRKPKADDYMAQAVGLAQDGGIIMPFVELYRYIQAPLQRCPIEWEPLAGQIPGMGSQFGSTIELPAKLTLHNSAGLTPREVEIATLASQGMYNREISQKLGISENTIKSALKSIFSKLQIHSRRELPDALKKSL